MSGELEECPGVPLKYPLEHVEVPTSAKLERKRLQLQVLLALNRCQVLVQVQRQVQQQVQQQVRVQIQTGYRRSPPSFPISGYRLLSSSTPVSPYSRFNSQRFSSSLTTTARSIDAVGLARVACVKIKLPSRRPRRSKLANVHHLDGTSLHPSWLLSTTASLPPPPPLSCSASLSSLNLDA